MVKWADYLVSHVRKNQNGIITHLLLYKDDGDSMSAYGVKTENEVINLIKNGYTVKTIVWGYPDWKQGALIQVVKNQNREYLRTNKDSTEKDNLDNLINLYN